MRILATAGLALALSACGGGDKAADDSNALGADNMMIDQNLMMDPNAPLNGATGMDSNASVNAATQNLMEKDATTHDPDTNLANGL